MSADSDLVSVRWPAAAFAVVDSEMGSAEKLAIMDDDEERAEFVAAITAASAAQVPWIDGNWPHLASAE